MKIDWEKIESLAKMSLSGDKTAYKEFLVSITPYLQARIRRAVPDHYIEDAYQEVILAIHKSLKTVDASKSIRPWINAIAHYKICDFLRLIYKDTKLDYEKEEQLSDDDWDKVELNDQLAQLIQPLSKTEQEVLMLLKFEEHTVSEVSKMLGLSESNVKVISFRAIRKLRESIVYREFNE